MTLKERLALIQAIETNNDRRIAEWQQGAVTTVEACGKAD